MHVTLCGFCETVHHLLYIDTGLLQKIQLYFPNLIPSLATLTKNEAKARKKKKESQSLLTTKLHLFAFPAFGRYGSQPVHTAMHTVGFSPGDTAVLCTSRQLEGGEVVQSHQAEEASTHWHRGMLLGLCCFSPFLRHSIWAGQAQNICLEFSTGDAASE